MGEEVTTATTVELPHQPRPRTSQSLPSPPPSSPLCWPLSKLPASLKLSLAMVPSLSSPPPMMPLPRSQRRLSTAFWLTRTPSQLCFSVMLSLVLLLGQRCAQGHNHRQDC